MRFVVPSTAGRATAAVLVIAGLLAAPAHAVVLTTPSCIAKKLKEWGNLRKCQAVENGKLLQSKPADLLKCQAKLTTKLTALNALATTAGIPCRYVVNADGTASDYDTGLQWERKTTDATVHDRGNQYTWSTAGSAPSGTVFTSFLAGLNKSLSSDGLVTGGCFAGHCDWRLPSIEELSGIVDLTVPGCGTPTVPCLDQAVFGPTVNSFVMSATTDTGDTTYEFTVYLFDGSVGDGLKGNPYFARAVRSAL